MGRQLVAQIFPLAWWQEWGCERWKVGAVEFGQAVVVDQRKTDLAGLWKLDVVGWSYSCGGRRTWSNVSAANRRLIGGRGPVPLKLDGIPSNYQFRYRASAFGPSQRVACLTSLNDSS
jgi:hypothetical protein